MTNKRSVTTSDTINVDNPAENLIDSSENEYVFEKKVLINIKNYMNIHALTIKAFKTKVLLWRIGGWNWYVSKTCFFAFSTTILGWE